MDWLSKYHRLGSFGRVLNISGKELSDRLMPLLILGESLNLSISDSKNMYRSLVAYVEGIVEGLDTSEGCKNGIRNQSSGEINRHVVSTSGHKEEMLVRHICSYVMFLKQFLLNKNMLRIIKVDISKQLVLMTDMQYREKWKI